MVTYTVALPLGQLLHVAGYEVMLSILNCAEPFTVMGDLMAVHPLASVTCTEYCPAEHNPVQALFVHPLLHK